MTRVPLHSSKMKSRSRYKGVLISCFWCCFLLIMVDGVYGAIIYPSSHSLSPASSSSSISTSVWSTSSNGTFSIGFFSLEAQIYYVGIWYSSLPLNSSVVWVANRDTSVASDSILQFTSNGKLQLTQPTTSTSSSSSSSSDVIWEPSTSTAASEAELFENGNFVLRDSTSRVIWQSFDHPIDTLLPGQNFSSSFKLSIVPWANGTNPSSSTPYSLVFGADAGKIGHVRLLYQNSKEYWSEPGTTSPYYDANLTNTTFSINSTGIASLYDGNQSLIWSAATCSFSDILVKMQVSVDGNLRVMSWSNTSKAWETQWRALYLQCDVFGTCGENAICDKNADNITLGGGACPLTEPTLDQICICPQSFSRVGATTSCAPQSSINCSTYMVSMPNTQFGVTGQSADYSNIALEACQNNCLNNCNCSVATYDPTTSDCWVETSLFNGIRYYQYNQTAYIKTVKPKSSFPKYAIILIVVGGSLIVFIILAGLFIRHRYRSKFYYFKEVVLPEQLDRMGEPKRFSFEDLYMVTRGFSDENKLGAGGFGSVYKGTFTSPEGKLDVAIKRLNVQRQSLCNKQDHEENEDSDFMAEIGTLGFIRHVNVVNLMGFCAQGPERLLVYEYVANGSLNTHLFSESSVLDWHTRVDIVVGAATGIEYLHTQCPKKIVHRDIKPHNILIDEDYRPKVADFGISQIMGKQITHLTNEQLRGTPTYMAPECWQMGALVTEKADTFSFGVMLLEVVSGRMVRKHDGDETGERISKKRVLYLYEALDMMEKVRWEDIVDERLGGRYEREDANRLLKLVFWCLQGNPEKRPNMEELLLMIKGHKEVPQPPLNGLFDIPGFGIMRRNDSDSLTMGSSEQLTLQLPEHVSQGR